MFGAAQRADLEALNRDLRQAQQELQKAADEASRRAAAERGGAAADRLFHSVAACPRLIRADLTVERPALTPNGPVELPGDTGALLFEVLAGSDGLSYTTSLSDLSQPPGESSLVTVEAAAMGRTYAVAGLAGLIQKRLASLAEVEQIVAQARQLDAEGKLENDRYRKELARQGGALLERVSLVRNLYADLQRVADAERPARHLPAP